MNSPTVRGPWNIPELMSQDDREGHLAAINRPNQPYEIHAETDMAEIEQYMGWIDPAPNDPGLSTWLKWLEGRVTELEARLDDQKERNGDTAQQ